ncbi:MAG: hypothetical protein WAU53_17845 [Rhodoplanes sp.]
MNAPRAVSLLDQFVAEKRLMLEQPHPAKARIRLLWALCKYARTKRLAAGDVLREEFMRLAVDVGMIDERGHWICLHKDEIRQGIIPYGRTDVAHVIDWALRGWNPFEEGSLE